MAPGASWSSIGLPSGSSIMKRVAGMCLIAFLVTVFPANVYAARKRVDIGGHAEGQAYLLARAPLQWLLVVWTYWFAVR